MNLKINCKHLNYLSCFSITLVKYLDQGNLYEKAFNLGLMLHHGEEHDSKQAGRQADRQAGRRQADRQAGTRQAGRPAGRQIVRTNEREL